MGICLDTEQQQQGSQVFDGREREAWMRDNSYPITPPEGHFPMHNAGHVKFEVPKVPVIFVLGGPGSGKVTHCDNIMQEKRGITHINMTDLLQQYAIGNDMKDFGQLSSKTVTEVLMLELKMAPAAKTYLISGYPRNMRDVVEYSEKIQIVNGVILVSWRQKILERQIDYGARLGHVVLSLAKMELKNFYKNVMPVAEYFDHRGMLIMVDGERNPEEVYKDFRAAVMRTLGVQDPSVGGITAVPMAVPPVHSKQSVQQQPPPSMPMQQMTGPPRPNQGLPPVIWVIGGPGSSKSMLCQKVVRQNPGWFHISLGQLLRDIAENTDARQMNDAQKIRQNISSGEMVPQNYVLQLVEDHMVANSNAEGIIIDGFPRDLQQVKSFENKFHQRPPVVLLDCSKLQLGRGRLDDSVAAFRRRLELFREMTLPMLKTMDQENRLTIVDGDTETPGVQEEFCKVLAQHIDEVKRNPPFVGGGGNMNANTMIPNGNMAPNGVVPNGNLVTPANMMNQANMMSPGHVMNAGNNMMQGGMLNPGNMMNVGSMMNAGSVLPNNYGGMLQDFDDPSADFGMNNMNRHQMAPNRGGPGPNMNTVNTWRDNMNPVRRTSRDTIRDMYAEVEGYGMEGHM